MLIVDAILAVARETPEWAPYCGCVPILLDVPPAEAPREFLRIRLSGYDPALYADLPEYPACLRFVGAFKQRFVDAVRAGRCRVCEGETEIDPGMVTVEALNHVKGDEWRLGGRTRHNVRVVEAGASVPGLELRPAPIEKIREGVRATHKPHIDAGRAAPNVNAVRQPVRDWLNASGFDASLRRIGEVADEAEFAAQRGKLGSGKPKVGR
jgi:hypothetical protein